MRPIEDFDSEFQLPKTFGGADPKVGFCCRGAVLWNGFVGVVGASACVKVEERFVYSVQVVRRFGLSLGYFIVVGVVGVRELMNEVQALVVLPLDVAIRKMCK
jgi:hypothetical protein